MPQPRRILVVDDDPAIRALLTATLEMEGYAVSAAADGEAALAVVAAEAPALILLDMRLPGLDGRGFARALDARGVAIPIVAMTGAADGGTWAGETGAADWLAKPVDLFDVLERVGRLWPPA